MIAYVLTSPSFGAALARFGVKTAIGLQAFFSMLISPQRQALHDFVGSSIVVHKSAAGLPRSQVLGEFTAADEHKNYSSVVRRLWVVLGYWFFGFFVWNVASVVFVSEKCARLGLCTTGDQIIALGGLAAMLTVVIATLILAWRGRLYGCRKGIAAAI